MSGPVTEDARPVIEYHRHPDTMGQGLHVYVFADGFIGSRCTPSIAGPITGDEDGGEYMASVQASTVDEWVVRAKGLDEVSESRYAGPPEERIRLLRIGEESELSYRTCGDLPAPVEALVDDILSSLDQTRDGNTDKAVPTV